MAVHILEGKLYAAKIKEEVKQEVDRLSNKYNLVPGLVVIIVGDNPASEVYVANKHRACGEVGINSVVLRLPAATTKEKLLEEIERFNRDTKVHGILVQMPLPEKLMPYEKEILNCIDPNKDVDGFHPENVGKLGIGIEYLVPCTPYGCVKLLELAGYSPVGKHAVIIGRSNIVGKPMALLLLARNATVTICHSHTVNLADITRQADILVVAVGKTNYVTKDMVKPGAIVIDVGINRLADRKIIGDVDFNSVKEIAGAITPVPGGVGLLTIAMLLSNTIKAAKYLHKID